MSGLVVRNVAVIGKLAGLALPVEKMPVSGESIRKVIVRNKRNFLSRLCAFEKRGPAYK